MVQMWHQQTDGVFLFLHINIKEQVGTHPRQYKFGPFFRVTFKR